ncbi:polysaccharide deacetylase family protein [Frankia sp. CiP3]|uniref:polysaccharide deacetylase family protein n=1 Tax=Frankia sp. CiP3 TaxID=2880971 RepID=UPI001EF66988|nr:polysaccharide deacetylase family protein [Frankia sp. CiP3]
MCFSGSSTRRGLLAGAAVVLAGCAAGGRTSGGTDNGGGDSGRGAEPSAGTPPTATAGVVPPSAGAAAAASSTPSTGGGPATELVRASSGRPEVALTFHTNGDIALVDGLLAAVAQAQVPITCMFVCNWLERYPDYARRVRDAGHEIGNHTYTHLADLDRQSAAVVRSEVERSQEIMERVTGGPGDYFRPSAMHHATPTVLAEAGRAGYAHCLSYDVDPLDYTDPGADAVVTRTLAAVQPGSVVSLHFGHAGTIPALPRIITGLQQKGLRPVTVHDLFA